MDEKPNKLRINIPKFIFFSLLLIGIFSVLSRRSLMSTSTTSESRYVDNYDIYEIHDIWSDNDDTNQVRIVNDEAELLSLSYRYQHFTDKEKALYREIVNACRSHKSSYTFVGTYTSDEVKHMLDVFNLIDEYVAIVMKPFNYSIWQYDATGVVSSIDINYDDTKDAYDAIYKSTMNEVSNILYQVQGMTQYDAEVFFHDYITRMCHYSESDNAHKASGVLLDHTAVCEGYSKAFKILCNRAGIPCDIVIGEKRETDEYNYVSNAEGHSWNLLTLDNKYYYADVTFDDNVSPDYYGDHSFLNITTSYIGKTHILDSAYDVPLAYSTKYNYYYMNGYVAKSESDIVSICASQMDKLISGDSQHIELMIPDGRLYEQFCEEISHSSVDDSMVFRSIVQCIRDRGYEVNYLYHSTVGNNAILLWFG